MDAEPIGERARVTARRATAALLAVSLAATVAGIALSAPAARGADPFPVAAHERPGPPQAAQQAVPPPAPPVVVRELQARLSHAVQRFEARDAEAVMAAVSDAYRTGPMTKRVVREQLLAIYGLHDAVKASARIDEVRMVGEHAWVYSTGEVSGRLRVLGTWVVLLSWQRELEVARRESGTWRLFGYQQ